jgi:hypothetical protein
VDVVAHHADGEQAEVEAVPGALEAEQERLTTERPLHIEGLVVTRQGLVEDMVMW